MNISQLPLGPIRSVTLRLSNGEEVRVNNGKVVVGQKCEQHLLAKHSPMKSFGPGTKVLRYRI